MTIYKSGMLFLDVPIFVSDFPINFSEGFLKFKLKVILTYSKDNLIIYLDYLNVYCTKLYIVI